jgi:hypothetical protein
MLRLAKKTSWHMLFYRGDRITEALVHGTGPLGEELFEELDATDLSQYAGAVVVVAREGTFDENFDEVMLCRRTVKLQNNVPLVERCAAEIEFYRGIGARIGIMTETGTVEWCG